MASSTGLVPGLEGDTLMAQMQHLFEPPGNSTPKVEQESTAELHPYFKRPGKGHNHDCCDSCSEGGALICCDSCPSSFHLQCHDPPLEDYDIPDGDWICIQCFASKPENQKLVASAKKKDNAGTLLKPGVCDERTKSPEKSANKVPGDKDWRPGGKGKKVDVGKTGRTTRILKKKMYADNSTEDEDCESKPFPKLEIEPTTPTRKKGAYKELYIQHLKYKPIISFQPFSLLLQAANCPNPTEFELPHKVDLPERFPYSWKWSSAEKRRKMLADEEPEPRGQVTLCYICVRSSRVGPLVRCDFCPLSFHLDCLDPPLSEVPRDVWMCPNHVEQFLDSKLLNSTSITERVALWDKYARQPIDTNSVKLQFMKRCQRSKNRHFKRKLKTSVRFKVKVPNYIVSHYKNPPSLLPSPAYERWIDPTSKRRTLGGRYVDDSEKAEELEWVSGLVSLQTSILKEKLNEIDSREQFPPNKSTLSDDRESGSNSPVSVGKSLTNNQPNDIEEPECQVLKERRIDNVDRKLEEISVKVEEDVTVPNIGCSPASTLSTCSLSPKHNSDLSSYPSLANRLSEYLAEHSNHQVSELDPIVLQYLAHRQLQTLLPVNPVNTAAVQVRATLTPLHSRRSPFDMSYRSINIGNGDPTGLNLTLYGHCNFLSAKHATIFFDDLSGHYELINYSPYGTKVDDILYSLDNENVDARFPEFKGNETKVVGDMAKKGLDQSLGGCYCSGSSLSGCEGGALLHHGSLLQFGCLQFVFSIVSMSDC